ncbi:MAG: aminotransferase class V-fold PLP-dependent enzyme [Cyclobacteriaceae bacterium]|nr:aminotransferase class V-fold PLP-dependent enzyme [Cyclobacteriaceae bacterium]
MISFYPGPSRVHDEVPRYVKDAHKKGILSMNHRSEEFMKLYEQTVNLLQKKLNVPKDYSVYFTSSATECWEIIAQSLVQEQSTHIFNGAFGEKWFDYTYRIRPSAQAIKFELDSDLPENLSIQSNELICITHNETSNGTCVPLKRIKEIRLKYPQHLIAIDTTSSMAGTRLDFSQGDVWFASVQKCFGLPAGLAVMICSPTAVSKMKQIGEKKHYNSLVVIDSMLQKWQTTYTPNVLGIYLLMRVLKKSKPINEVSRKTHERYEAWAAFFKSSKHIRPLVKNKRVQSQTVLALEADPADIEKIKSRARKKGLLIGNGYGELKSSTFRIANFPALKKKEIKKLMDFLKLYR